MFDAGEWNDNPEAQSLTRLVISQKRNAADSQQDKGAISRRKRLKRNRQLLEILQTLKSSGAQNPDLPPPPADAPPSGKKKKATPPDIGPEKSAAPHAEAPPPDTGTRLNRQQWKNKMRNRRRNRNKFKPCLEKTEDGESRAGGGKKSKRDPSGDLSRDHGGKGKRSKKDTGSLRYEAEDEPDLGGRSADKGQKKVLRKEKTTPGDTASPRVTPAEKARLAKLKKLLQREEAGRRKDITAGEIPGDPADAENSNPPEEEVTDRSASLRSRMEQRLSSARFRYINEQLYTSDSQEAVQLFQSDPEAFTVYHTGFSQQVQRWPVNPITEIIKYIKNRPASLVVADFGCGDAQLARSIRNKVHSFDLVALNDHVTVCDMAQVPLSDRTVDIAVFCLSLMGKNLGDFLKEANRVLKMEGVLLVAEVSSRFDDTRQFLTAMSQLGFKSVNKNTENSHFYLFEFSKVRLARDASKHPGLQLKPCLYKKR
ncbi:ribosomal RNA-processing protein 8 isoform 1-T3 [Mantella aurantiaca]